MSSRLPDIVRATAEFEHWAARHVHLVSPDVRLKHKEMAQAAFPFFRATFYRWAQLWPVVSPELARAPRVLAVGDLHVENFGTWRDIEGRLIWGVNDFDEAWPASYAADLVRLVSSAYLAIREEHLSISRKKACRAIEHGYRDSITRGGSPFVLAEHHNWLRLLAVSELRDPVAFWKKILAGPKYKGQLPKEVWKIVRASVPLHTVNFVLKSRVAGLGSLGHPRVLALAEWDRAHVAREAKQLAPSAWIWAKKLPTGKKLLGRQLVESAVRIQDPHVHFGERWVVRRLAPDCSHIELGTLPADRDEEKLLYCMGWETGNVHLGSPRAIRAIRADLRKRKDRWLHQAAKSMLEATLEDWKHWRKRGSASSRD